MSSARLDQVRVCARMRGQLWDRGRRATQPGRTFVRRFYSAFVCSLNVLSFPDVLRRQPKLTQEGFVRLGLVDVHGV